MAKRLEYFKFRKGRLKNEGFNATAIEYKDGKVVPGKGFDPLYAQRPRGGIKHLYGIGVYQALESWMMNHPGEAIPKKKFMEQFNCSTSLLRMHITKIAEHHGLPKRGRGGLNNVSSPEIYQPIDTIYKNASKGSKIIFIDAVRQIARETGKVCSYELIRKRIKKLDQSTEKSKRKNIVFSTEGGNNGLSQPYSVGELVKKFKKEGIKAVRDKKRTPNPQLGKKNGLFNY